MDDSTPYAILGLTPGASPEDLKRAYRDLVQVYAVTGSATLGHVSFMDYIAARSVPSAEDPERQKEAIHEFAAGMARLRTDYWNEVPEEKWPATVLLLALPAPDSPTPAVWRLAFDKKELSMAPMPKPVYLEGPIAMSSPCCTASTGI
jgi:hypothetical protein